MSARTVRQAPVAGAPASSRSCLVLPMARLLVVLLVLYGCTKTADTVSTVGGERPSSWIKVRAGDCGRGRSTLAAFVTQQAAGCPRARLPAKAITKPTGFRGLVVQPAGGDMNGRLARLPLLAARSSGFGSRSNASKRTKTGLSDARTPLQGVQSAQTEQHSDKDSDALSAQERRMLQYLRKFGKLHVPSSVETKSSAPGQALREQKEEMAKVRRDEKVALRQRQGSGVGKGADVQRAQNTTMKACARSRGAKRTGVYVKNGTSDKVGGGGKEKPHANVSHSHSSEIHSREARGPRVRHAAVRTNGALRRWASSKPRAQELRAPANKEVPIPHNIANYTSMVELLAVLEPFCEAIGYGKGCKPYGRCCASAQLSPSSVSDAVGALNRLKRLRPQIRSKHVETRTSACVDCLCAVVLDGMPLLSGKLVSLAVNAVAHNRCHSRLITAAGQRAIAIAQSGDENALDVQAVSVIVNGFARAGVRDVALFTNMSAVAKRLMETKRDEFGAQAISVIANAFVKMRITDEDLFTRLARCAERVPPESFTPQAIANMMNAYARHNARDEGLFNFLSHVSQRSLPAHWLSRHLALVVNALAKLEYRDDKLLAWIAQAALSRPTSAFDVQAIANILNGYGKMHGRDMDRKLLLHMASALRHIAQSSPQALDPQSIASSLNALVKTGYQDVASDSSKLLHRLSDVAMQLDPLLFDAQSVSTIMHSLAKLEVWNVKLFRRMSMIVGQMEFILEPQSIALIINACAKVGYEDFQLMKHLSRIASSLPADTFSAQHVENILNGFARLDMRDRRLFLQMAQVIRMLPAKEFDPQAVAIIMNSYARVMPQDEVTAQVFHFFSHNVLPMLSTADMQATSLSIILNAFAKAEIRDEEAIGRLCSLIVSEDEGAALQQGASGCIPVQRFDGRHIASVMHAIATLHVEQPVVLNDLVDQLLTLDPAEQLPEEVAIIAWSVAVLNLRREDMYVWVLKGLDFHIGSMGSNFRRQAHQFLLTYELEALIDSSWRPVCTLGPNAKPRDALRKLRKELSVPKASQSEETKQKGRSKTGTDSTKEPVPLDYISSQHRPSRLQKDVALILSEMDIGFIEEYIDERSGYSLDMLLSDKRTAIEVDGPCHYATGTHRPLGNTKMKHRHLAQLGFDLRILPYWEWDELTSKEEKKAYIRQLLTATPSVSVQP